MIIIPHVLIPILILTSLIRELDPIPLPTFKRVLTRDRLNISIYTASASSHIYVIITAIFLVVVIIVCAEDEFTVGVGLGFGRVRLLEVADAGAVGASGGDVTKGFAIEEIERFVFVFDDECFGAFGAAFPFLGAGCLGFGLGSGFGFGAVDGFFELRGEFGLSLLFRISATTWTKGIF